MRIWYLLFAAVGGALLPLQAIINARLGRAVGGPSWAAGISFAVGMVGIAVYLLITRKPGPMSADLTNVPWWAWGGGLLGAVYVISVITVVPVVGATALVAFVILGQLVASTVLDHLGAAGMVQSISATRVLGLALLAAGAVLVLRR